MDNFVTVSVTALFLFLQTIFWFSLGAVVGATMIWGMWHGMEYFLRRVIR